MSISQWGWFPIEKVTCGDETRYFCLGWAYFDCVFP